MDSAAAFALSEFEYSSTGSHRITPLRTKLYIQTFMSYFEILDTARSIASMTDVDQRRLGVIVARSKSAVEIIYRRGRKEIG
jgi:hypothetical protein